MIVTVDACEIKKIVKSYLIIICDMKVIEAEHVSEQIEKILEENQTD